MSGTAVRVAALYDIHGNLPALEAVLNEIAHLDVTQLRVGGDVVSGPMPLETLELLLRANLPVEFIRGNADREVQSAMQGHKLANLPEHVQRITCWAAQQLRPDHARQISQWPATHTLHLDGLGQVLFCHATPHSDTDVFTKLTPEARLQPIFDNLNAQVVICGHTHMPFDRKVGQTRVVNAGSVGLPYGRTGAAWLLLADGAVHFQHTPYDLLGAAERIRQTTFPDAETFANGSVLTVPSEAEALKVFTQMELTPPEQR